MTTQTKKIFFLVLLTLFINNLNGQDSLRWAFADDGGIQWKVKENDSHMDHVEMSGFKISAIVHYGVENGRLKQMAQLVFPMLRTIPNDTHASFIYKIDSDSIRKIMVDGKDLEEFPTGFHQKGILSYSTKTNHGLELKHQLFPSVDNHVFIEIIELKNTSSKAVKLDIPKTYKSDTTIASKGVDGSFVVAISANKNGTYYLRENESFDYAIEYSARLISDEVEYISPRYELKKREEHIRNTFSDLVFVCPDEVLNSTFAFAKLRAVESIYKTKEGLMHGPGGGRYYAAIWANDQAEYANPFFPYLGNLAGNESAINSFRHFTRFINDDYKPIPSSIIAEGLYYWNGAGDRGDMAMIAYGASRFALAYGDRKTAQELWPLIEWSLEYCKRKMNSDGVILSDCDELEGRFPAGEANLNTSSLYYDALISASMLGKELNVDKERINAYLKASKNLRESIDKYFSANIDGFETYRYYKGNEVLRAWICTPLTVGIFDRSKGTINALFSDKLWTKDGLATESGKITFWDRATLYGLRGVFAAGEMNRAMDFFLYYSNRRLLGEHVPYAVEAYPEGNQRHLSAESALYCRVVIEGIWGIRPEGFNAFTFSPKLPSKWNGMELKSVKAFNHNFDLLVKRKNDKLYVKVYDETKVYLESLINQGETIKVQLD